VTDGSDGVPPRPTKSKSSTGDDKAVSGATRAKASGSKVAKAARAGKTAKVQRQESLLFPLAVLAVMILGVALVVYARSARGENLTKPRFGVDDWSAAYGVYVCDAFRDPEVDLGVSQTGITGTSQGVISIAPVDEASAGSNARMQLFFDAVGLIVTDDSLTVPDGTVFTEGTEPGCGGEKAELRLLRWGTEDSDEPSVIDDDFGRARFLANAELFVLAYVPVDLSDDDIPKPPQERIDVVEGRLTPTTTVAGTDTTVAGTDTTGPTTTAASAGPTTSSVPPETTTG
jgi:hypothetical protein